MLKYWIITTSVAAAFVLGIIIGRMNSVDDVANVRIYQLPTDFDLLSNAPNGIVVPFAGVGDLPRGWNECLGQGLEIGLTDSFRVSMNLTGTDDVQLPNYGGLAVPFPRDWRQVVVGQFPYFMWSKHPDVMKSWRPIRFIMRVE